MQLKSLAGFAIIAIIILGFGGCSSANGYSASASQRTLPPVKYCDSSLRITKTLQFQEDHISLHDIAYLTTGSVVEGVGDSLMVLKIYKNNQQTGTRFIDRIFPEFTLVEPSVYATFSEMDISLLEKKWVSGEILKTQYAGSRATTERLHHERVKRYNNFLRQPHGKPYQMLIVVEQGWYTHEPRPGQDPDAYFIAEDARRSIDPMVRFRVVIMDAASDEPVFANAYEYSCDFRDWATFSRAFLHILQECRNDLTAFSGS